MLTLLAIQCSICKITFNISNQYQQYQSHVIICNAQSISSTSSSYENSLSLSAIFDMSETTPIPRNIEDAALHIIKNKIAQSNLPNNTIEFKTGGPRVSLVTNT